MEAPGTPGEREEARYAPERPLVKGFPGKPIEDAIFRQMDH